MALPIEERLKNLEQKLASLESSHFRTNPKANGTFHGVIVSIPQSLSGATCSTGFGYLEVMPFPPLNNGDDGKINAAGHLEFDTLFSKTTEGYDSDNTFTVKVYPVNIAPKLLKAFYNIGEVVEYWQYNGTGEIIYNGESGVLRGNPTNPETIVGRYVCHKDDPTFLATVEFDETLGSGINRYDFTAKIHDTSVSSLTGQLRDCKPCSEDWTYTGKCYSYSDYQGSSGSPLPDGTLVEVKRIVGRHASNDIYLYWAKPIGAGGGANHFPVLLSNAGGNAGTSTTRCDLHYTVTKTDGTLIGDNIFMTGIGQRIVNATCNRVGTEGYGYVDGDGEFILLWANEGFTQDNCDITTQ